ncbi:Oidioi.mRNA.OKI2018_I69.chr2.g8325.t1.cds [Oikopleura dioica]|uniref:Oidioi.mRNA.OKI2018_I69.chr2.g8325.t1.cds n=1 Tax=Oikopleura dioica TaxID=34765 RepID=A0ABN7T8W8_OIKDI|nr:Oidioi.mRNA.OKI2018_I69.chr2.g8325.t1.cds [Oikopleura dioica]
MKGEKVLRLSPSDRLAFQPPFEKISEAKLLISNISNETVAFKIKTTAPKRYCVRPNTGVIGPLESKEINIALQPGDINQRHKFMIQSIIYPENFADLDTQKLQSLWSVGKEDLMSQKLAVDFLTENGSTVIEDKLQTHNKSLSETVIPTTTRQPERVQFDVSTNEVRERKKSPKVSTPEQTAESKENKDAAQIAELKGKLADAMKQIEILSSSPVEADSKNLAIYLAIAFFFGLILSSLFY